ncbi:MAG: phenylalanine--tRNA ligase beta subunit-related protein [Pirellulales bacterium]
MMAVTIDEHPCLEVATRAIELERPLADLPSPPALLELLREDAPAPFHSSEAVRTAVRDLLRVGGFKPTGRSKPASEYLLKAVREGLLQPINRAVDVCNVVSLHSGLPISVVDLDQALPPLRIGLAPAGSSYVFNASGQTIDLGGLLCLFDAAGPCANAVKDAQRTKTQPATRRLLVVIWGTQALAGRAAAALQWYEQLLAQ